MHEWPPRRKRGDAKQTVPRRQLASDDNLQATTTCKRRQLASDDNLQATTTSPIHRFWRNSLVVASVRSLRRTRVRLSRSPPYALICIQNRPTGEDWGGGFWACKGEARNPGSGLGPRCCVRRRMPPRGGEIARTTLLATGGRAPAAKAKDANWRQSGDYGNETPGSEPRPTCKRRQRGRTDLSHPTAAPARASAGRPRRRAEPARS